MTDPLDLLIATSLDEHLGAVSTTPAPANPRYRVAARPQRSWGAVMTPSSAVANRLAAGVTMVVLAGTATGIKGAATGSFNPFDWGRPAAPAQRLDRSVPLCGAPGVQSCISQRAIVTAPPQTDPPTPAATAAAAPAAPPAVAAPGGGASTKLDNGHGHGHGGGDQGHGHGHGHGDDGGSGDGNGEG